ncbi:hypothetical protein M9H77_18012 [Catharanthus roseus]|uniref:Uncharacterized protein n=2 Tax=Catharanthus roseus TaxID=4058 RepID=A0ACC0B685_CATRO|nr:hypothetical protein M9H77_17998 [Catharanthus roseus]KAI5668159.1 hypothetical protein M9H77_18012 [Catharanthus roseus]
MISTRKLIRMARKWQKRAAIGRKRVSLPQNNVNTGTSSSSSSSSAVTEKGHVVIYTADQNRYSIPIAYLNNYIFRELLRMAEEEFGLPSNGPITIPCEAVFMDYLISLIQRRETAQAENALLTFISACRCSSSYNTQSSKNSLVHCF